MISVVRHNCIAFIDQKSNDIRSEMLLPLKLLLDINDFNRKEDSVNYKKACDLYYSILSLAKTEKGQRLNLLADELMFFYSDYKIEKNNLLTEDELNYLIDFIDAYSGFKVF